MINISVQDPRVLLNWLINTGAMVNFGSSSFIRLPNRVGGFNLEQVSLANLRLVFIFGNTQNVGRNTNIKL